VAFQREDAAEHSGATRSAARARRDSIASVCVYWTTLPAVWVERGQGDSVRRVTGFRDVA